MKLPQLRNLGPFVGRHDELARAREDLRRPGFVTLVGPGGVGKTRLALELAADRDNTAAVWLDELHTADDMAPAIASALGLVSVGDDDIARIADELRSQRDLLLLIDNAEHLVAGVRELVDQLPLDEVQVLVTSRVPLELPSEHLVRLAGLTSVESRELLHARSAMLSVKIDDTAEDALLDALDGLPLAIELAAARMTVLSPTQILDRLQQSNEVLGSRDPSRHGALDRTIAWSWEHLDADERSFLTVFAMFNHAIEPAFVEALWPDLDVWNLAQALESKSWLQVATVDGAKRWATLRSIRRFLTLRLEPSQLNLAQRALTEWARRHRAELPGWWASFVVEGLTAAEVLCEDEDFATAATITGRCFFGAFGGPHFKTCVRQAISILEQWSPDEDPEQWSELAAKVSKGSFRLDVGVDPLVWSARAYEHAPPQTTARLAAGSQHSIVLLDAGRRAEANEILDLLFEERSRLPQDMSIASALLDLAISAHESGRFDLARQTCETVLALSRAEGQKDAEARAWIHLSYVSYDSGNFDQAAEEIAQLERLLEKRHPHEALTLGGAVPPLVDLQRGLHDKARRSLEEREEAAREANYHALEFYLNIAWAKWAAQNAPDDERVHLERALVLASRVASNKSTIHVRFLLTLLDIKEQNFTEAATSLRRLADRRPPASPEEWAALLDATSWFCAARRGTSDDDPPASAFGELLSSLHAALRAYDRAPLEATIERYPPETWSVPGLYFLRVDDLAREWFAAMMQKLDSPRLVLQVDGRKIQFSGEATLDLSRRGPLRRILVRLAHQHGEAPGEALTADEVIAEGWPDEKILHDAALARVYTTMKRLRRLGFENWLVTTDEGYALEPGLLIEWTDELD